MAVPIVYDSCLSDEALTAAVANLQDVKQQRETQQHQMEQFKSEQLAKQDAPYAAGETFEPEIREWPEIECTPFLSTQKQFVVCLDTMGQDREFTVE